MEVSRSCAQTIANERKGDNNKLIKKPTKRLTQHKYLHRQSRRINCTYVRDNIDQTPQPSVVILIAKMIQTHADSTRSFVVRANLQICVHDAHICKFIYRTLVLRTHPAMPQQCTINGETEPRLINDQSVYTC